MRTDRAFTAETRRKAIHLAFILLPLQMIFEVLPWPRTDQAFRSFLLGLGFLALAIDLARLHERRAGAWFRRYFGEMVREHEKFTLLGSSYIVLAALIALAAFPREVAAAALGYTVLGDAVAAMVGMRWGRTRLFRKSLEGGLAGLVACLGWAWLVAQSGLLPWDALVAGALVASLVEMLPIPLDDNLGMTLASAVTLYLLGAHA